MEKASEKMQKEIVKTPIGYGTKIWMTDSAKPVHASVRLTGLKHGDIITVKAQHGVEGHLVFNEELSEKYYYELQTGEEMTP